MLLKHLGPVGLLAALLVLPPVSALAHPDVDAGKHAFQKGDFREALQRLASAERSPELKEDELVEVYWYRGMTLLAMANEADAVKSFDKVLSLRPLYEPSRLETPPPVRQLFEKRADLYRRTRGVSIRPPTVDGASLKVVCEGNISDLGSLLVFARAAGDIPYKRFEVPASSAVTSVKLDDEALWKRVRSAGRLELVVEARRSGGAPVARSGDAVKPIPLDVKGDQVDRALAALAPAPPPKAAPTPATPPPSTTPPPPAEPAPKTVVIVRPSEQPAASAPPPAPVQPPLPSSEPPPAPAPAPAATPVADEGSPMKLPLQAAGAAVLAGGLVIVVLAVVALAASAASWGAYVYTTDVLGRVGADFLQDRETWVSAWYASWIAGSLLLPSAALLGVIGLIASAIGVATFVRALMM